MPSLDHHSHHHYDQVLPQLPPTARAAQAPQTQPSSVPLHLRAHPGRCALMIIIINKQHHHHHHPQGARVDVSVSELYDSTYVGNPHDMISQVF